MPTFRLGFRVTAAVALPLAVAALVAFLGLRTVAAVEPGSARAAEAATARALAAELRAPGPYLLEAFMVANQLPTVDPAGRVALLARLDELRVTSEAERLAWAEQLADDGLRSALVGRAGETAQAFWAVVDANLRPVAGDRAAVVSGVLAGPLAEAFARHTEAAAEVSRRADERAAAVEEAAGDLASGRRWLVVAVLVAGAAVAVLAAAAIARSLARRAEQLREATLAAADALRRAGAEPGPVAPLPLPPGMDVHDELGEAAAAVGALVGAAARLVADEGGDGRPGTDVFVNLGRRNQGLLTRQLDLVEELERSESDPDRQAALGRLGHLAACQRRNAESLLVIAGLDPPRRWSRPVDALDLARAATAETEQGDRVRFGTFPAMAVAGPAAAAVAHLLAELIDNALRFSPPRTTVSVTCRPKGGELVLAVGDEGVGMDADALEDANALLAAGEGDTPAGDHLGHVVVSRLAVRHGLAVELESVSGEGLTAWVTIPAELLEPSAGATEPRSPVVDLRSAPEVAPAQPADRRPQPARAHAAPGDRPEPGSGPGGRVAVAGRRAATGAGLASGTGPASGTGQASATGPAAAATTGATGRVVRGADPLPAGGPRPADDAHERTPSGFRRRVPKTGPAAPTAAHASSPAAGAARRLRPLPPESASARKSRLDSFVAGRSTADQLLGLEDEAPPDDGGDGGAPAGDGPGEEPGEDRSGR